MLFPTNNPFKVALDLLRSTQSQRIGIARQRRHHRRLRALRVRFPIILSTADATRPSKLLQLLPTFSLIVLSFNSFTFLYLISSKILIAADSLAALKPVRCGHSRRRLCVSISHLRLTYTLSSSRWPPSSTHHSAFLSKPSPTPTTSTASQSATLWKPASPRRSAQSWPWRLISFRQDRVAKRASSSQENSRRRQARACLRGEETSSARSACEKRK